MGWTSERLAKCSWSKALLAPRCQFGILNAHTTPAIFTKAHAILEIRQIIREQTIAVRQRLEHVVQAIEMRHTAHQPMVHPATILDGGQQTRLAQDLEMARQLVLGLHEAVHQLAKARFLPCVDQKADNSNPRLVREGLKDFLWFDIY